MLRPLSLLTPSWLRAHVPFLFESVEGGERWGRYSIIGLPAKTWLSVEGYRLSVYESDERVESHDVADPLQEIERYQQRFKSAPAPDLPVFHGGLVGYFGYDTVRYTESKLMDSCPPDELNVPDILLVLAEEVLIFDGLRGTLTLVVNADATCDDAYKTALVRLDEIEATLWQARGQISAGSISIRQWTTSMPARFVTEPSNLNMRRGLSGFGSTS